MAVTTSIYDVANTTLALIKTYLGGDGHQNFEPIHDAVTEVDAALWNKTIAGLAEIAARTRKGLLQRYSFYVANATAGMSAVALQSFGPDAAHTEVAAPFGGSVVAIVIRSENARTAGTATAVWTKAGSAQTLSAAIDGTNTLKHRTVQLPGVETFAALDLLGVKLTTDGSWAAGSTPSVWVDLYASLGEEETL